MNKMAYAQTNKTEAVFVKNDNFYCFDSFKNGTKN